MHVSQISVLELRRLFYELKDHRPDICVRLRLLGAMWQSSFSRVIKLTENGVVLLNEHNNQAIVVKDLRGVVQFEIDAAFQNYQPHNHYNIKTTRTSSKDMLVLAVDDDKDDLELFCEAVKEIDPSIKLMSANNGDDALNYLHNNAITYPDFVFLDINMPLLDGRECLKAIRNEKLTKNLSVIMYSTSLAKTDKELFEQLNAKFLTKASTYDQLLTSLREIFGQLKDETEEPVSLI